MNQTVYVGPARKDMEGVEENLQFFATQLSFDFLIIWQIMTKIR